MATTTKQLKRRASRHNPAVRRADIPKNLPYEKMSELGQKLFDIRAEIVASGEPLLSQKEIEIEIARRRGGYQPSGS